MRKVHDMLRIIVPQVHLLYLGSPIPQRVYWIICSRMPLASEGILLRQCPSSNVGMGVCESCCLSIRMFLRPGHGEDHSTPFALPSDWDLQFLTQSAWVIRSGLSLTLLGSSVHMSLPIGTHSVCFSLVRVYHHT